MKYCAIQMNSLTEHEIGTSPVEGALHDLEDGGTHEGMVSMHIIDAPYGLGKADWDMSAWTKDDFTSVLKVSDSFMLFHIYSRFIFWFKCRLY